MGTPADPFRRDPNRERRSGDGRDLDPILRLLRAGHYVRAAGDPDEEERLRRERVAERRAAAAERRRSG